MSTLHLTRGSMSGPTNHSLSAQHQPKTSAITISLSRPRPLCNNSVPCPWKKWRQMKSPNIGGVSQHPSSWVSTQAQAISSNNTCNSKVRTSLTQTTCSTSTADTHGPLEINKIHLLQRRAPNSFTPKTVVQMIWAHQQRTRWALSQATWLPTAQEESALTGLRNQTSTNIRATTQLKWPSPDIMSTGAQSWEARSTIKLTWVATTLAARSISRQASKCGDHQLLERLMVASNLNGLPTL